MSISGDDKERLIRIDERVGFLVDQIGEIKDTYVSKSQCKATAAKFEETARMVCWGIRGAIVAIVGTVVTLLFKNA